MLLKRNLIADIYMAPVATIRKLVSVDIVFLN